MITVPLSLMCHSNHHATGKCITIERGTIEPKMMKAVLEFIFFKWHTAKYRSNPCRWSCLSLKPKLLDFFLKTGKIYKCSDGWNVWGGWFLAGNQGNDQNFENSLLTKKLWRVFVRVKQKKKNFEEKIISKWPTQKKCIFQNHQFSKFFCENFMDQSLG